MLAIRSRAQGAPNTPAAAAADAQGPPAFCGLCWLGVTAAGLALALSEGGCDGGCDSLYGCYDPYVFYAPDYLDWTFWYDDGDWWYPGDVWYLDSVSGAGIAEPLDPTPPDMMPVPTPGTDELNVLKAQMALFNKALTSAMGPVARLMKLPAHAPRDGVKEYGPADLPTAKPLATLLLSVTRMEDHKYGWHLSAKPIGAADSEYKTVLDGTLANIVAPHRGIGQAEIDLDALHAISPTSYPATGRIVASTSADRSGHSALFARLVHCSLDGKTPPQSFTVAAERTAQGIRHVKWSLIAERVPGTPDKGPEWVSDYLSWRSHEGGRIYTRIEDSVDDQGMPRGDLPPGTYLLGQSCYAMDASLLYRAWTYCDTMPPLQCLTAPPSTVETPGRTLKDCPAVSSAPWLPSPTG
jgi:hypothetical protein